MITLNSIFEVIQGMTTQDKHQLYSMIQKDIQSENLTSNRVQNNIIPTTQLVEFDECEIIA